MSNDKPFFISQNTSLGEISAQDELLHLQHAAQNKADSLTETQYFGFCIPEKRIHGYGYLWHHANLRVVSGGLFVWQGHKRTVTHSELCDFRNFMSDAVLHDDLHQYRLENGYGVEVVEPLKRHRVTYSDSKRQNLVALDYEAVSPPVMFGDGNHFEQAMRVKGEVVLRGERHEVNCYTVRDRSWGKPRPEDNLPLPAMSWMQGVFNENFAFNCNLFDAGDSPELKGTPLSMPADRALNGGWLWRDGQLSRLVSGKKWIVRRPDDKLPCAVEFVATDELARTIHVKGKAVASTAWMPWSNVFMPIVLMRWECEGSIAYGDLQEGVWNDFLNLPV
ncbi:conserved hypothetical protein [Paraburkholderia sacchari]|uniref:DUF7064 domain-containing protein n=1 Tax=Paraburkholderia sacchari TaxID=159450 RepID=UPI0039A6FE69